MVERTMFVIAVPSLESSSTYYREVLGFDTREMAPGWRFYAMGACRIMAGECPDALPARDIGDHSYFAYLVIDDIEAYHAQVVSRGADLIKPLREEPWRMREFGVRTIDGHRIMFGQEIGDGK